MFFCTKIQYVGPLRTNELDEAGIYHSDTHGNTEFFETQGSCIIRVCSTFHWGVYTKNFIF